MEQKQNNEEEREEVEQMNKSALPECAARAVLYSAIVYAITYFFPSVSWLWYVLGAYIIFDIFCLFGLKILVQIYNKQNQHDQ